MYLNELLFGFFVSLCFVLLRFAFWRARRKYDRRIEYNDDRYIYIYNVSLSFSNFLLLFLLLVLNRRACFSTFSLSVESNRINLSLFLSFFHSKMSLKNSTQLVAFVYVLFHGRIGGCRNTKEGRRWDNHVA